MGVNVEISGRENSKELLRPESMVKFLAFGQARWDDPLKDQEDQTIWLAKWEMSVQQKYHLYRSADNCLGMVLRPVNGYSPGGC